MIGSGHVGGEEIFRNPIDAGQIDAVKEYLDMVNLYLLNQDHIQLWFPFFVLKLSF